jgi:hypothetical protein
MDPVCPDPLEFDLPYPRWLGSGTSRRASYHSRAMLVQFSWFNRVAHAQQYGKRFVLRGRKGDAFPARNNRRENRLPSLPSHV